jgi:putative flippase GtrA
MARFDSNIMTTKPTAQQPDTRLPARFGISHTLARPIALSRYRRQLKFLAVGAACFVLQMATLVALLHLGVTDSVANATSFLISAETKFVLSSRLVWNDPSSTGMTWRGFTWFNFATLAIFFVDQFVFVTTDRVLTPVPAAILGVAVGTIVSYLVCDRVIFRSSSAWRIEESSGPK